MKAMRTYKDCSFCNGAGIAEVHAPKYDKRGLMTCILCTERYVIELRTVLYNILERNEPISDMIPGIESVLKNDYGEQNEL